MNHVFESFLRETRYALRAMCKAPGFALLAILTLALGIGATTAMFTVVDSVVLKPLTYHNSGQLVVAWERAKFLSPDPFGPNPRHADLWRKRATAFSGLTLLRQGASGLAIGKEHPRLVGTVTSSPNLFDVLEVTPLLGRSFRPEDAVPGRDQVAILTYALWQTLFQGDPNVIGKTIRVADTPREVVGVLPANFRFPNSNALRAFRSKQLASRVPEPALFLPAAINMNQFSWNGEYGDWIALGRLKRGISVKQAEAQLTSIEAQVIDEMPANERRDWSRVLLASVQPMQEAVVGGAKTGLWFLMAAVLALMLIACVNLANAQLGRALSRDREAAVRSALGASKWQLVWNSLAENLLLATAGGAAGILLATAGLSLFRRYSPLDLPRSAEIHLNVIVLLFALLLTLGSSLLFGVLPALNFWRVDPQAALQQNNSRTLGSRQNRHLRSWLIGLQVFGSTVLLLLAGLFSKSLLLLLHEDKGFETGHVVVAEVDLPAKSYGVAQSRVTFDDTLLNNLRAISGVHSAALVSAMPLEGESWIEGLTVVGRPNKNVPLFNLRWVSPEYFETMREKLLAGRFFEERDRNLKSVVLSQSLANSVWRNESPLGAQVEIEGRKFTIIGVVADSRNTSLKSPPAKMAYLHYADRPPYATFFLVRGAQPANTLIASVRQAIWNYAPDLTIARVKTLDSQLSDSLTTERFETDVVVAFGSAALLLAMLGIYSVLSYATARRKQEIGVRMALGATRRKIYALTLGEAATPVFLGLAAGLTASVLAARTIQKLLYGVKAVDPFVASMVFIFFLTAALTAAFLPVRRAASVDPMEALRAE